MMKSISLLFFFACTLLLAQNTKTDTLKKDEGNSINFSTYFNPLKFLPDLYLNNEINNIDLINPFPIDSASILLQTRMQLSKHNLYNPFDAKTNLLNPLYQNYKAGQSNRLMYQILGAVQVGAVGILAYKHIEKYYIKKKK